MSRVTELAEKYGITSNSNDNIEMFAAHLYNDGYHAKNRNTDSVALRDHFAGLAMQSLIAGGKGENWWVEKDFAWNAYRQADAMLKEREKE